MRYDIFCTIVDNFGDIGITWRLARQLRREHGLHVRLWVDDLASFKRIRPEIDAGKAVQSLEGVEVHRWKAPFLPVEPADVVIEALACDLPEAYVAAMAACETKPVWINLEYLSAEDWVSGCHALPSPHPRLPLTRYFFFPGYVAGTGGVLREASLLSTRDAFQASLPAREAFWRHLGVPPATAGETRVSLFAYENRAIPGLLQAWAEADEPMRCLVPLGRPVGNVAAFLGLEGMEAGKRHQQGGLTVHVLPMLAQDEYDRLLWACDCNFVRGEDSFVRAQWARRPLVWQAYVQEEGAHWPKIEAFLHLYRRSLDGEAGAALERLWREWNAEGDAGPAWAEFWARRGKLQAHAAGWCEHLLSLGDLASNLVQFCAPKLQ